jgi:WD40 repeat protein
MDLRDGEEEWMRVASKNNITALAFSPDGKTLASAAGWEESDIRLWDVASGNDIGKLDGHTSCANSLVFWPDGNKLASSSADQTIRTWDIPSRQCLDVLRGHRHEVWRLALLPDNQTLISACKDGTVCVWDTSVNHPRPARITLADNVAAWRFTSDSRSVVTLNYDGKVTRWSGVGFQDKETLLDLGRKTSDLVGVSVAIWKRLLFSPDCRFLAMGSTDGRITGWDVFRRIPMRELNPDKGIATPLGFRARGNHLICYTSEDNLLSEWDLEANRGVQTWPAPPSSPSFLAFSLSPDERLGIATGWHGDVVGRDLSRHENIDLPLDALEVLGVAFSPDGKSLAIASTLGFARVWDTATWEEQATLEGFLNAVFSVSFSPNGRRLATGGANPNDALKLWDVDGWQEVLTLKVEEGQGSLFI